MAEDEDRLLTMYADVHYYFTEPSPRPASHRFDKGSYVYLYRDARQDRGRLEVANHAGTEYQDAFTGDLGPAIKLSNSYRQPCLVTIVVNGSSPGSTKPHTNETQWRLPSTDPRDEGNFLFHLHTVDVYFWTPEDARTFIDHARSLLREDQLALERTDPPVSQGEMSPVVQQLENVAITDEANERQLRDVSSRSRAENLPSNTASAASQDRQPEVSDFTPMAYNPAAPPAPEQRAHREKTPPPPEITSGAATAGILHTPHASMSHQYRGSSISSGAPSAMGGHRSSVTQSPFAPSPMSSPGMISPPPSQPLSSASHRVPSFAGPPNSSQGQMQPETPEPLASPGSQILGSPPGSGRNYPLQHLQPQYADYLSSQQPSHVSTGAPGGPPMGGYSNYSYQQASQQAHMGHGHAGVYQPTVGSTGDAAIHSQVYRPTEAEYAAHRPSRKHAGSAAEEQPGRWEQRAEKAEKGLNKFLRKVEKKIG